MSISTRAVDGRSPNWLCAPCGQQQVHLLERVQQREGVGDDRGVVVLLVEDRAAGAAGCGTPRGTSSGCRPAAARARPCRRASARSGGRTRTRGAPRSGGAARPGCSPRAGCSAAAADRSRGAPADRVRRGARRFWKRRLIALMVWTSIPSSCQYDQISSSRHGDSIRELNDAFAMDSIDNRLVRKRISQDSVDIRQPSIPEIIPQSLADFV